jgi:hypothetical protein
MGEVVSRVAVTSRARGVNGVATGNVRGICPECSSVNNLGSFELGQEITCWDCGTNFVVQRVRHRSRQSHRLRTSSLLDQFGDATLVTPEAKQKALLRSLALPLVLLVVLIVAANWSAIETWLEKTSEHVPESVPVFLDELN